MNDLFDEDAIVSKIDAARCVERVFARLTPREQEVLRLRYFEDLTLCKTAKRIGVTAERVRQIEAKALRKARKLVDYERDEI